MGKYTKLVEEILNEGQQYVLFYPSIEQGQEEDYKTGFKTEKEALAWGKKNLHKEDHREMTVKKMSDKDIKNMEKDGYDRWAKKQSHLPSTQQDQNDYENEN